MNKNSPKILFNKEALPYFLEIFGKTINEDGYISDAETGELTVDAEKNPILAKEFGGIKKGSEIFLKNDLFTMLKLAEDKL